jgi:hypothetical protein
MYREFYGWNGVEGIVRIVYNVFWNFCPLWERGCYTIACVLLVLMVARLGFVWGERDKMGCFEFLIL